MMSPVRSSLCVLALSCAVASAAALVPVSGLTAQPDLAALEPNRGQAKPEILFLVRGTSSMAVTAQSVLYSPFGAALTLVGGNVNPAARFSDPLPGIVNSFSGADTQKWVTGIPRFGAAHFTGVYPGIDADYTVGSDGQLTLHLLCSPGSDWNLIDFEIEKASVAIGADGTLRALLGSNFRLDPSLLFPPAVALQEGTSGSVTYKVQSTSRFGREIVGFDRNLPLQVQMKLGGSVQGLFTGASQTVDGAGNTFVAATIPDAAGKGPPCGISIAYPISCMDAAVYKVSKAGQLVFASYLSGASGESASFVGLAPDGALIVTGTTNSADFPITPGALQASYGGPAPNPNGSSFLVTGDFFAVRMNAATGVPQASTFLGGPNAETVGETALGSDGSVYFLPKWLGTRTAGMPVTPGAMQPDCTGDACVYGDAAHLSPTLDRLLYGTYLPGTVQATARLHSDGSVYYAGSAGAKFPTTPGAFQRETAGDFDGIVARLDPSGTKLLFATYIGGKDTDWILRMAVAADGSVWVAVSSFVQCCVNITNRLVRLDASGQRLLADKPIAVGDLAVDPSGNLLATAAGAFQTGPDALLANACAGSYLAYLKLSPSGEQLFATFLPAGSQSDFDGTSDRGLPILTIAGRRVEVVEGQSMGVFAGCLVDAASFGNPDLISPGAIGTLFGSRMGPREGVAFQLQNGRVPTSLSGTRVLVNGSPCRFCLRPTGR